MVTSERDERIQKLKDRGMSQRGAEVVVDAAMFGKGCIPHKYALCQAAEVATTTIKGGLCSNVNRRCG